MRLSCCAGSNNYIGETKDSKHKSNRARVARSGRQQRGNACQIPEGIEGTRRRLDGIGVLFFLRVGALHEFGQDLSELSGTGRPFGRLGIGSDLDGWNNTEL